jgi:hypothetical protein
MNRYKAYLRKRPHYGDMINEIELNPPNIKYPDRTATLFRNTRYMFRFDGDLGFVDLEDQENKMAKERLLEEETTKMARETKGTHLEVQADSGRTTPLIASSLPSEPDTDSDIYEIDRAEQLRRLQEAARKYRMSNRSRNSLQDVSDFMTSDFDFDFDFLSVPNSARGSAEPLVERPSASTSTQHYAFGINAIPLPRLREQDKAMQEERRRRRQKTPPPPLFEPPQAQARLRMRGGKSSPPTPRVNKKN